MSHASAPSLEEIRENETIVPRYDLHEWREEFGVIAGITGADHDFDLGLWGTTPSGVILQHWGEFQSSFGPAFFQFVVGHQQHGTELGIWSVGQQGMVIMRGVDGHVTGERGTLLTVLVADCVPVYLLDPVSLTVALLHAGWRGIAAGILESGIRQLELAGISSCSNLVMHCGVSICRDCYEVGAEVIHKVTGTKVEQGGWLDLRADLLRRAEGLGIRRASVSPHCTVHDSGLFHSYRARGAAAGRMGAYLGVPLT